MYPLNMRKKLTLVPIGGLANRLYAITSAIAFCEDHDIDLKVVWFKDWGMGAGFHALFELAGNHPHVEIIDATWKDYIYDRPRKKNFWLPYLYQKLAFDKRFYEKDIYRSEFNIILVTAIQKYSSLYLVNCCPFYDRTKGLLYVRPNLLLRQQIEMRKVSLIIDEHTIGIHIRRTDNSGSIQNSPLELFIDRMHAELAIDPNTRFYVASDDLNEKIRLKDIFGDRVRTILEDVRRDNLQGIKEAVIELYTLSSTKSIFGSVMSTYSMLAAEIGNIPIELLSKCNK